MWTFKPGYLGACIVAVAILGGLLLGSVANVSTHQENTTAYEYKTDITGLFDVSQEPQFLEFNPASNYTGYSNTVADVNNPSGIEYTHTNIANNYRILTEQPHAETGPSGTVNNSTDLPQYTFTHDEQVVPYRYTMGANGSELVYNSGTRTGYLMGFKVATMYDWVVSVFGDLSDYQTISLTIPTFSLTAPSTRGGFGSAIYWDATGYYSMGNDIPLGGGRTFDIDPVNLTYSYTVNTVNGPTTYSRSLYTTYIYYGDATQYETKIEGGHTYNDSHSTSLTIPYTSVVTRLGNYDYMLPANGTEISPTATGTIWDNDQGATNYDNYSVNLLIGPRFDSGAFSLTSSGRGLAITLNKVGGGTEVINVAHCDAGGLGSNLWITTIGGTVYALGHFPAVMLAIEKSPYTDGDKINFYPVTAFNDYLNVSVAPDPILSLAGSDYDLDNITFNRYEHYSLPGADNIAWSVYNTVVFMETYNAVFHNPSINLADYWPDMDSYRFSLSGVALYGDSVTINGVNYPVTDQTITINNRAYTLKNCYISFSKEGTASITFNDINRTVDLGPTVSKVLSFYGNWGFTMGLYEGVLSTKDVYDWDVKLLGDNLNTCILIALGVLAVVTLACIWLKVGLKLTDKLVLGAGALILVMFLVV